MKQQTWMTPPSGLSRSVEGRARGRPDLGIVVPAHNEASNLQVLYDEVAVLLRDEGVSFEFVLVDDGSSDETGDVIRELNRRHPNVQGVILSRNYGHQAAISEGLRHVRGQAVAIMDADLQDRPSDLVKLYTRWRSGGADVVYAIRQNRKEHVFKRAAYRVFYRLLARTSNIQIPVDSGDFCVMDAAFVERLNALPERLRFVRGLRAWLGGDQVAVPVERDARRSGSPQYTFLKLVHLAVDGLVSFSSLPLRLASFLGLGMSLAAFCGIPVVLLWKFTGRLPSGAGTATMALSILMLGGIQLLTIGILGEYVGRVFEEVKARPTAVVSELLESGMSESVSRGSAADDRRVINPV